MPALRWILLILYVGLIGGLFALGVHHTSVVPMLILLAVTVAALAVFILGAGRKGLCLPIRRPRMLFPVAAASFMLAAVVLGMTMALAELFESDQQEGEWTFWLIIAAVWLFWGVLLYVYARKLERYEAIFRLAQWVFAGSLAELLAALPSHVIVTRRGGCFAGIGTGLGIFAGLCVMIWSFGPGIFLLFLQEVRRREHRGTGAAQREPPAHGAPFQFSLRTMLLVMLATSVVCGLLRTFWGRWPAAAVASLAVLVLLIPLLAAKRWLLLATFLGVVVGLVWVWWKEKEWTALAATAIPMGISAVLLVKLFARRTPVPSPENGKPSGDRGLS
jgi:hypothetical protein